MPIKYTDEFLISEIHRFVKLHNRVPRLDDMHKPFPSVKPYLNRYGTWNNMLQVLGYAPTHELLTDEFLIAEFNRYIDIFGCVPSRSDFDNTPGFPSATAYRTHFGNYIDFLVSQGHANNINRLRLTGNETCSICGTLESGDHWRNSGDIRMCKVCYYNDYRNRPETIIMLRNYKQRPAVRARRNAYKDKRDRNLGHNPLNKPFDGAVYHHLHLHGDTSIGIFIPEEIHKSIYHAGWSHKNNYPLDRNMNEINTLAFDWFRNQLINLR